MAKTGKISPIRKDYSKSAVHTMQSELAKKNMTRIPGTGVFKFPYKEFDGKYRTGLDPDAAYIKRIQDQGIRESEIERVTKLKKKLEDALGVDLGPRSQFWDHSKSKDVNDKTHIQPVKLQDSDNFFDLSDPFKELTFSWLRVHPTIASSFQAYERGEFPADVQWFVADDDVENERVYKKKKLINKAIKIFEDASPERRRKIARQLGLPISDNTREDFVYNQVDNILKQTEFKDGNFRGLDPVNVFLSFAELKENELHVKDLIKQAITHSVYRMKKGSEKIYEGENEVAKDEKDLVKFLLNEDNQEDLIMLEEKLKKKKIASV